MRIVRQKNYSDNDENKKGVSKKDVAKFAALKVGGLGALLGSYAIPSVLSDEGLKKEEELGRSHQEIAGKHSAMMEDIEDKLNVKIKPDEDNLGSRWDKEKNTIFLDNKSGKTHSGLVHEAGHAKISKGKHGKILKHIQDDLYMPSKKINSSKIYNIGQHAAGYGVGYMNGKREVNGEKENSAAKWATRLAPTVISSPVLISEGAASLKGIQMMKRKNVDPRVIKAAKESMAGSYLTYARRPLTTTIGNETAYQAGKMVGKYKENKKKQENND